MMIKLKTTTRRIAIASTLMFACLGTTVQANELSKQVNQDVINALSNAFSNQVSLLMIEIKTDVKSQINQSLTDFSSIVLPIKENESHLVSKKVESTTSK